MDTRDYVEACDQDLAQRKSDVQQKLTLVRDVLKDLELDAIALSYTHNFSWITSGGRNFINMASDVGVGSIYVDATRAIVLTNPIEGHRLINEELMGLDGLFTVYEEPWFSESSALKMTQQLSKSEKVAVDVSHRALEARISLLRVNLTSYEMTLFSALGKECGQLIGEVARELRPSMTEWDIAGALSVKCWALGITPVVILTAVDERVDTIRHPLPTNKRLKNKAMLVVCGRRAGFVCSVTRMVYVTTTPGAKVPAELLRRHEAATYVDAVALARTVPGAKASDVFASIQAAYAEKGFVNEEHLHHQGGACGYKNREWIATPTMTNVMVGKNQAYAWNPSVTGTKSEDTVLFCDVDGKIEREVISQTPGWPLIHHTVGDVTIARPGILHLAY